MRIENINAFLPEDMGFVDETTEPQMDRGELQISGGITFIMQGIWPADSTDEGVAEQIVNGMGLRMLEWAVKHAPIVIEEFVAHYEANKEAEDAKHQSDNQYPTD